VWSSTKNGSDSAWAFSFRLAGGFPGSSSDSGDALTLMRQDGIAEQKGGDYHALCVRRSGE
jgi:hypothetical protein